MGPISPPQPRTPTRDEDVPKQGGPPSSIAEIVGTEMDALAALSAALEGVAALDTAIELMKQAASSVVTAGEDGKKTLDDYVTYPIKPRIDKYAKEAVTKAAAGLEPDPHDTPERSGAYGGAAHDVQ